MSTGSKSLPERALLSSTGIPNKLSKSLQRSRLLVQVGFFAEAGPLQVFVSGHLIPEDFEYSQVDEPAFVSADEEVRIQQGTEVRLRIVGTRTDASEIVSHVYPKLACINQHREVH